MTSYFFKWGQKLLALAVGVFFAQTLAGQIENVVATASCGNTCNGKLIVRIKADVAVPLHLTLIDGGKNLQEKKGVKGRVVEFLNVCPGAYTLFVEADAGGGCKQKDQKGIIPSLDLQAVLKEIKHPTTASSGDGKISVGVNSTENVTYLWNNGSSESLINNLNPGTYTVTITAPAVGCSISTTYTLKDCTENPSNAGYDFRIIGGIADNKVNGITRLELRYVPFLETETQPLDNNFAVTWKNAQSGAVLGQGHRIELNNSLGVKEVKAEISDGCRLYTVTKQILSCSASAKDLADRFISHISPACYGTDGGSALFEFTTTPGDEVQLDLLWDENRETFFKLSGQVGVQGSNGNWVARVENLIAGKTYTVQGYLGYDCPITFSFKVPIKPSQKVFSTYDQNGYYCEFTEFCDGKQLGPSGNLREVPKFDLSKLKGCKIEEVICGDKKIELRRKDRISGWEEMPATRAVELLEKIPGAVLTPFFEELRNLDPCTHVRFCKLNPFVKNGGTGRYNFVERLIGGITINADGCQEYTCLSLVGIPPWPQKHKVCVKNYEWPPIPDFGDIVTINVVAPPQPERNKCEVKEYNLLQMLLWHRSGSLEKVFGSKYKNSMLENQLKNLSVTSLGIRCGKISFCLNDLNKEVKVNLATGCGATIVADKAYKCGIRDIVLRSLVNGGTYSWDYTKKTPFELESTLLSTLNDGSLYSVKFFCGDQLNKATSVSAQSLPDFAPPIPFKSDEDVLTSLTTGEEPLFEPLIIPIVDTFSKESLLDFGYVKYLGNTIPKGIMATNNAIKQFDYAYDSSPINKENLTYRVKHVQDWDAKRSIFVAQLGSSKEYALVCEDSSYTFERHLITNDFLLPQQVSIADTTFVIAGVVQGNLSLDSFVISNTSQLSAFVLVLGASGLLHSFTLIENIDTTQGIYFSENRAGTIMVATAFKNSNLLLNGQAYNPGTSEGLLLCKWNNGQFSPLKVIQPNAESKWKGVSLNAAADQINIAITSADSLRISGDQLASNAGSNVVLAALSAQGTLKWQHRIQDSSLQVNKMGIVSDDAQGLLFALTYRDSLDLSGKRFTSAGQDDVLLGKLDAQGSLKWSRSVGTVDQEEVSQVSYSSGLFFYGGQFSGATKLRPMGEVWYDNRTPHNERVYISFVIDSTYVPDTTTQVPNTEAVFIPMDKGQQIAPLQVRTPQLETPEVQVYPNPFRNEVTIEFMLNSAANYTLRLIDNLGGTLKSIPLSGQVGYNAQTLQTNNLPAGMYFLQLTDSVGRLVKTMRVVKL